MIGATLAHYRITGELGAGGMGEVWRAQDTMLGRDVALKVLSEEFADDAERLERFEREARAVATLNHPHIVTIFSVEEAEGVRFLTMELIEGRSLDKLIPEGGLDFATFLELATPVAEAISAAHDKSVIHRDLKPSNVMVDGENRVKVLDFGLAKLQHGGEASDSTELPTEALTGVGTLVGTVPYMSPEQIEGKIVDHRTDIFSLGVLLYEMATGNRPFAGDSQPALMSSILRDVPQSVLEIRDDVPRHLGRIIGRCLEKDRRDRYQTARDVFNELRALWRETSGDSTAPLSSRPRHVPAQTVTRRKGGSRAIVVAPFRAPSKSEELAALAEGLTEDIAAGLARFPYLTILGGAELGPSDSSTSAAADRGARYVLRGGLRSAGTELRLSVQLVEMETGAHVWSEAYDRRLDGASLFELQDGLTDRIVATVGDYSGVVARLVVNELRAMDDDEMTVDDWIMRAVCYVQVIHPPEEHAAIRNGLEKMVELHPDNAEAHAWLANAYVNEFAFGFNPMDDPIGRSLQSAQRAVDLDPTTQAGWLNLAGAHFFLGDVAAFEAAATRAMALNPRNSYAIAYMGLCFGNSGQRERGAQLGTRACALNPHHPEWYPFVNFYHHYAREEYEDACSVIKGINWPKFPYTHINFAAACGQLGRPDEARSSIETLRNTFGFDLEAVRKEFLKWGHTEDFVDHMLDGLRKAGLDDDTNPQQSSAVRPPSEAAVETKGAVTIAVLPFNDLSPARDQDYFCEGMAEEIMNALVHVEGIRVASRTSTFKAVEKGEDLKTIGRKLSVGQILEGSVRVAGDRLRVTAQLTEVESGYQLWSERYDRQAEDVFAIQDEIAAGAVEAVISRLAPGEHTVREREQVGNLEAYRHFLKGRHYRYSKNDHANALRCFEEAVALDPSHGPSWVAIAESKMLGATYNLVPAPQAIEGARAALATAEAAQGESAESLYVQGQIAYAERRWDEAERVLRRAAELEPNNVRALCWLAVVLSTRRNRDEAMASLERAREADPLAAYPYGMSAACCLMVGDAAAALDFAQQAAAFEEENTLALWGTGIAAVALGRMDEGVTALEEAAEVGRRAGFLLGLFGWALAAAGRTEEATAVLGELRARPKGAPTVVSEAWLLAALGRTEEAWAVLEQSVENNQPVVSFTEYPGYDPLRSDPRFTAFVEGLGLPPSPAAVVASSGAAKIEVPHRSIVVLPFANLSPDPDTEYFSDGLTDEIITDLSRVRALRVISRSSAMRLKDDERGLAEIGRDLDCRYVLEGSVRRAANNLRITARLVDAPEDIQLWADKYAGTLDDVFDIQERVSRSIVDALEIQLTPEEAEQLAERPIDDIRAQESYLRARNEIWSFMPGSLDLAISHLEAALDLIGDNVLIYQGLGEAYFQYVNIGAAIGREEEFIQNSETYADKIFALEPESPRGYMVRAQVQLARGDIHGCARSLRRVLQAYPNEIVALQLYTHILGWLGGKPDAATPVAARLVDIDPLNPMSLLVSAMVPLFAGRFSEAVEAARRMFDLDPVTPVWRANYVMALCYARRFDEAESLTEAVEAEPDSDVATWQMGIFRAAWREGRAEVLRLADGPYRQVAEWDAEVPWLLAAAHAAVGANHEALHWLDRAIDAGMINYPFLSEHDWLLNGIRGEERFCQAMERARLEWERFDEVRP